MLAFLVPYFGRKNIFIVTQRKNNIGDSDRNGLTHRVRRTPHFFLAWFSCQRHQDSPHLHPQNTNTCNKLCIPMLGWAPPFLPSTQINPSAGVSSNHSHISFLRNTNLLMHCYYWRTAFFMFWGRLGIFFVVSIELTCITNHICSCFFCGLTNMWASYFFLFFPVIYLCHMHTCRERERERKSETERQYVCCRPLFYCIIVAMPQSGINKGSYNLSFM